MAKLTFTSKAIENLTAPLSGQMDYWDISLSCFGLRVSSSGRKSWIVMYRFSGRLRRLTLGPLGPGGLSLAEARKHALCALNQVNNGLDPAEAKKQWRHSDSYSDLVEKYLKWAKDNKSSWPEDERILNHDVLPYWKNLKLTEISKTHVRQLLDRVICRGAKVHANRTFSLVRRIFNFGLENELIHLNPCHGLKRPCSEKSRERVLSLDEIRAMFDLMEISKSTIFSYAVKLSLLTAQRPGEIVSMRWENIDFEGRVWTIPGVRAKNRKSHRVPISRTTFEILLILRSMSRGSSWVFQSEHLDDGHIYSMQPFVVKLRQQLQFHFTAHDLRRTAASQMTAMGIPRLVVAKILNHTESGITHVYDRHSYEGEKREALESWDQRLMTLTGTGNKKRSALMAV